MKVEIPCSVGPADYNIRIERRDEFRVWVSVDELTEFTYAGNKTGTFWKSLFSTSVECEQDNALEILRDAVRSARSVVCRRARDWDYWRCERNLSKTPSDKRRCSINRDNCKRSLLRSAAEWQTMRSIWRKVVAL